MLIRCFGQAEAELGEAQKREELDAIVKQARSEVLRTHNLPTTLEDSDPRIKSLTPPIRQQVRAKAKEMLIDEEVRRRK